MGPDDALKSLGIQFHRLLTSDVRVTEMSGDTLALRAKQIDPDIKILLVSGMASTVDVTQEAWTQPLQTKWEAQ